jgi:pilus biogenesis lipoprotein CpaD
MAARIPPLRRFARLGGRAGAVRCLLACATLLLPSCVPASPPPPAFDWPAAPRAEQVELRHVVRFATDSDRLAPDERARLASFLDGLPGRPVGRIRVAGHADERASDVYNLDLAARRARAVAEFLRSRTDLEVAVDTRSFGESRPVDPGHGPEAWARNRRAEIEVVVPLVVVEGCDAVAVSGGHRLDNGPFRGLGCATARNLAAMLADPADLGAPRELAPAPAQAAAAAVDRYREGKVTPLLDARDPAR